MKYRARVIFRTRVQGNERPTLWEAAGRIAQMVSRHVRGWVDWEGSLAEVFRDNIRRVGPPKYRARIRFKLWVRIVDEPQPEPLFVARNLIHDRVEKALIPLQRYGGEVPDWLWPQVRDTTRPARNQW